jgi:hypothetical protein
MLGGVDLMGQMIRGKGGAGTACGRLGIHLIRACLGEIRG